MPVMSKLTAAYLAGLIDGEGSLEIRKKGRKYEARIRVWMVNYELIKWLYDSFGGFLGKREFDNNCKTAYGWTIKGKKQVEPIIKKIRPYLKVKKNQAELIIKFLKTFDNCSFVKVKNKSEYHNGHHLELSDDAIENRDIFFYKMKELNRRGKLVQPERLSRETPTR